MNILLSEKDSTYSLSVAKLESALLEAKSENKNCTVAITEAYLNGVLADRYHLYNFDRSMIL